MKKIALFPLLFAILLGACTQNKSSSGLPSKNLNFIVASDMGRHGKSEQRNIAELMGQFAEQNKIEFLVVAGDPIHDNGVKSVKDEEWKLKIEDIYTAPSLHAIPWYVISGNHEYNGSVQAILDYSNVSERWNAPARYYSMEHPVGKKQKVLLVFIDTTPLIDKYRNDEERSDAPEQDMERQLCWLDSVLVTSNDRWKIVIGHHPVYADTEKEECERTDMQVRLAPILEKNAVTMYVCGHIHNFQHIKPQGSKVEYFVNSSASKSRPANPIEGTVFCNSDPGFSVISIYVDRIEYNMINHEGKVVYNYTLR